MIPQQQQQQQKTRPYSAGLLKDPLLIAFLLDLDRGNQCLGSGNQLHITAERTVIE